MKKELVLFGVVGLLFILGLSGCTQEDALSGLGYVNEDYGIGFNPPEGWIVNDSSSDDIVKLERPEDINNPWDIMVWIDMTGENK